MLQQVTRCQTESTIKASGDAASKSVVGYCTGRISQECFMERSVPHCTHATRRDGRARPSHAMTLTLTSTLITLTPALLLPFTDYNHAVAGGQIAV
jgi:hypothetical protein